MKLNIWKVSTLVFGGALAFVIGRGGVAETSACDVEEVSVPNRNVQVLRAALGTINRAETQLQAASNVDRGGHRTKALAHLTLAMDEVEKSILVANTPTPRPKPMARKSADQFVVFGQ
jgi:hypothetical protein